MKDLLNPPLKDLSEITMVDFRHINSHIEYTRNSRPVALYENVMGDRVISPANLVYPVQSKYAVKSAVEFSGSKLWINYNKSLLLYKCSKEIFISTYLHRALERPKKIPK